MVCLLISNRFSKYNELNSEDDGRYLVRISLKFQLYYSIFYSLVVLKGKCLLKKNISSLASLRYRMQSRGSVEYPILFLQLSLVVALDNEG